MMTRREALRLVAACALWPQTSRGASVTVESVRNRLPTALPAGVASIIANALNQDPTSFNTDWFGTVLMDGLLRWQPRAFPETRTFAQTWLDYHRKSTGVSKYSGPPSRSFHAGGVELTSYAGQYGISFPCFQLASRFGDDAARAVCIDVADFILHQSARNRLGMVAHDDNAEFAIPDTCYFVAGPLMFASTLSEKYEEVFRRQALIQLRTYTDVFLVKEKGLAKTVLLKTGLGETYWTRASGWLLWAMISVLEHLPAHAPETEGILHDLKLLAEGLAHVQDAGGGFHVLLDDPTSPLETTGSAMFATGLHEAIRNAWLPDSFRSLVERAWSFVQGNISDDGSIEHVYTAWAMPAEKRIITMNRVTTGWVPGFILLAANEMTLDAGAR
jgi:rhamnogalacturonyl hydrolase YesR